MYVVYQIRNKKNDKRYIGQTTEDRLKQRWWEHNYCRKNERPSPISLAIKNEGSINFDLRVLEVIETLEEAWDGEVFWINFFDTCGENGYNRRDGGRNAGSRLCALSRLLMSEAHRSRLSIDRE